MISEAPASDHERAWLDFSSREGRAVGYLVWCIWALAFSAGVSSTRDDVVTDLVPLVSAAAVVGLILHHHRIPGYGLGLLTGVAGLLLIPALDLLLHPPCESVEFLRIEPGPDGSTSVSCARTVDMTMEVLSVFAGLVIVLGLVWFLLRIRRKQREVPAATTTDG